MKTKRRKGVLKEKGNERGVASEEEEDGRDGKEDACEEERKNEGNRERKKRG